MTDNSPTTLTTARHESVRAEVRAGDSVTPYLRAGAGRPILLLGSFDDPRTAWPTMLSALAERFRVIVPELAITEPDFSSWLRTFLDGLGLFSVSLVADERRALAAIAFALVEGERVDRLVLLSTDSCEEVGLRGALADSLLQFPLPLLIVHAAADANSSLEATSRFLLSDAEDQDAA